MSCDGSWWSGLGQEMQNVFGSVSVYRCPSGLGPFKIKDDKSGVRFRGPTTDYCVPVPMQNNGLPVANNFGGYMSYGSTTPTTSEDRYVGPFRRANLTLHPDHTLSSTDGAYQGNANDARSMQNWGLRDTMAYWQDGTSNQIIFMEKHIPTWTYSSYVVQSNQWNGSWLHLEGAGGGYNIARSVSTHVDLFARGPNDPRCTDGGTPYVANVNGSIYQIGSGHSGVVNFLVGDGSVKPLSIQTDPLLIWRLSNVQDGTPVSLN